MGKSMTINRIYKELDIEKVFTEAPNDKYPAFYRIMNEEHLVSMFQNKELVLVNPNKWEDPFEAHWASLFTKNSVLNDLNFYGLCFTKDSRSDAMWKIYSAEKKGIRIRIDKKRFWKSLQNAYSSGNLGKDAELYFGEVQYCNDTELVSISKNYDFEVVKDEKGLVLPWFAKRDAFKYEMELRLLLAEMPDSHRGTPQLFKIPLNPRDFITSLQLDGRLSEADFINKRIELSKKTGFPSQYIIHSQLYKLPKELR